MSDKIIHTGVLGMRWGKRRLTRAIETQKKDVKSLKKHGFNKQAAHVSSNVRALQKRLRQLNVMEDHFNSLTRGEKTVVVGKEVIATALIGTWMAVTAYSLINH
jgi:predicted phage tail protein